MMMQPVPSFGDFLGFNSHFHVIATDPPPEEKTWHVELVRCYSGSGANQLREPMWYIRLWRNSPTETFIIYDDSSSPGADDPPSISSAR
jgi:hypothetical protein